MNKQNVPPENGAAGFPLETIVMHLFRMLLGWLLYWLVAMAMPAKWWVSNKGWFWWSVPFFGYYAYQPNNLKWWQQMENGE